MVDRASRFRKVEYLQSTGTQYIDTGISRSTSHTYRFIGEISFDNPQVRQLIGAQGFFYFGTEAGMWQVAQPGTIHTSYPVTANERYVINFFANPASRVASLVYNGNNITISQNFENNPLNANICIFSLNSRTLPMSGKVYNGWQIYVDGILQRDFITCYDTQLSVGCMYDNLEQIPYYNAGTGNFIVGGVNT